MWLRRPGLLQNTSGRDVAVAAGRAPVPDGSSLLAAKEAFALVKRANDERALLIFLISGGGS